MRVAPSNFGRTPQAVREQHQQKCNGKEQRKPSNWPGHLELRATVIGTLQAKSEPRERTLFSLRQHKLMLHWRQRRIIVEVADIILRTHDRPATHHTTSAGGSGSVSEMGTHHWVAAAPAGTRSTCACCQQKAGSRHAAGWLQPVSRARSRKRCTTAGTEHIARVPRR